MRANVTRKWRPPLWGVIAFVLMLVLALPFAGFFSIRLHETQLVQQTEESLITQAALMAETYAEFYRIANGQELEPQDEDVLSSFRGITPSLRLSGAGVLPPRPNALPAEYRSDAIYAAFASHLTTIAERAQYRSLAGYRFLDQHGTVIAGTAELGTNLGHIEEVADALSGTNRSVARARIRQEDTPWVYRLSPGTAIHVFVAFPVTVDDEVIGAVYISRTPNHIFRFLYGERESIARASLFVAIATLLIGGVFWRFIARPIGQLTARAASIGYGRSEWIPLAHYGTKEIEMLGRSFHDLTERLQAKQSMLKSYTDHVTHELKSPLSAIKGAAELMQDGEMSDAQREKFLQNVLADTRRMEDLLASMRRFSAAETGLGQGESRLSEVAESLHAQWPSLEILAEGSDVALPLSEESLLAILVQLVQNSAQHGANRIKIIVDCHSEGSRLCVSDDGRGISPGNRDKLMTPFFTTRRSDGGTGMGLNIVQAMAQASGGILTLQPSERGTCFEIQFLGQK